MTLQKAFRSASISGHRLNSLRWTYETKKRTFRSHSGQILKRCERFKNSLWIPSFRLMSSFWTHSEPFVRAGWFSVIRSLPELNWTFHTSGPFEKASESRLVEAVSESGKSTLYSGMGIQFHMEFSVFQFHSQSHFWVDKFHTTIPNPIFALCNSTFQLILRLFLEISQSHSTIFPLQRSEFVCRCFLYRTWLFPSFISNTGCPRVNYTTLKLNNFCLRGPILAKINFSKIRIFE